MNTQKRYRVCWRSLKLYTTGYGETFDTLQEAVDAAKRLGETDTFIVTWVETVVEPGEGQS